MAPKTPSFSLAVEAVTGSCPAGERYAMEQAARHKIPVLSCEGPCIRGEIARRAATMLAAEDDRCARACHAEAFFVPHSAMNKWVRDADHVLMIDGCFLQCHGRVLRNLVPAERVIHVDALRIHRKFADVFLPGDVSEHELTAAARRVADSARRVVQEGCT